MELYTKSRDGLYEATATYDGKNITVNAGSRINLRDSKGYTPSQQISDIRGNREMVDANGILLQDITFSALSTAATFVTGRIANGMIVWKTENGRYIRYTFQLPRGCQFP